MIRELFRNTGLSLLMNVSIRAANALVFVLIGRSLGASAAGTFHVALAYVLIFSVMTRGLDDHVTREVALAPQQARRYFTSFVIVRLLASTLLYGVLVVWTLLQNPELDVTGLTILVAGASIISDSLIHGANAVILGLRRFALPTVIALALCLSRITVTAVLLSSTDVSILAVAMVWLISSMAGAALSLVWIERALRTMPVWKLLDFALLKKQISSVWPFLINGFLLAVEFQIDVILLSILHGELEVGLYGGATTIVATIAMLSQAYRFAVYPLMTTFVVESQERLVALYEKSLLYLAAIAVPIVVGLISLAPGIVALVFSSEFTQSTVVMQILAPFLLFNFLSVPNNRLMFVHEKQSWITWTMIGSMSFNLVLNVLLTPRYGAQGAAWARVSSSLLFFVSTLTILNRYVLKRKTRIAPLLWRPLIAAACMAIAVQLLQGLHVVLLSAVGAFIYLVTFVAIGGLPSAEREFIWTWLQHRIPALYP
jgi:O-antigen/teichoic acid export membrane protein